MNLPSAEEIVMRNPMLSMLLNDDIPLATFSRYVSDSERVPRLDLLNTSASYEDISPPSSPGPGLAQQEGVWVPLPVSALTAFSWPTIHIRESEESIPTMSTMPVLKLETPHTTQPVSPDVPPPVIPSAAGSTTPTTPERIGLPGLNGGQIHVVRAHQVQIYLNSPDKNGVVRVVQYNTTAPQHVGTTVC
jgi:hypothetical protein